jgi:hypothetical protein
MGRLLELIVAGVILWLFLESWVARLTGRGRRGGVSGGVRWGPLRRPPAAPPPPASDPRPLADVTLVRCAACGTHVPQGRAISSRGASYCSERCQREAERAG